MAFDWIGGFGQTLTNNQTIKHKPKKKPEVAMLQRAFQNISLAMTYSHMGPPTLPSALRRFTTEFGMGSGGSISLLSPSNLVLKAESSYSIHQLSMFFSMPVVYTDIFHLQ